VSSHHQQAFDAYRHDASLVRDPEVVDAQISFASSLVEDLAKPDPNVFAEPFRKIASQLLS
jgi:hypothetical protein